MFYVKNIRVKKTEHVTKRKKKLYSSDTFFLCQTVILSSYTYAQQATKFLSLVGVYLPHPPPAMGGEATPLPFLNPPILLLPRRSSSSLLQNKVLNNYILLLGLVKIFNEQLIDLLLNTMELFRLHLTIVVFWE